MLLASPFAWIHNDALLDFALTDSLYLNLTGVELIATHGADDLGVGQAPAGSMTQTELVVTSGGQVSICPMQKGDDCTVEVTPSVAEDILIPIGIGPVTVALEKTVGN